MKSVLPTGRKTYAYVCRDHAHILRTGAPLDGFVTGVVVGRLSRPDAHLLLQDKRIDIPALQAERNGLQSRLDKAADDYAEGAIESSQLRRITSNLRVKLAGIDAQLADAARTDPVAGLIAEREVVQEKWDACTPAIKGQIIDALITVTIMPCPSSPVFDPQYVRIDWKR